MVHSGRSQTCAQECQPSPYIDILPYLQLYTYSDIIGYLEGYTSQSLPSCIACPPWYPSYPGHFLGHLRSSFYLVGVSPQPLLLTCYALLIVFILGLFYSMSLLAFLLVTRCLLPLCFGVLGSTVFLHLCRSCFLQSLFWQSLLGSLLSLVSASYHSLLRLNQWHKLSKRLFRHLYLFENFALRSEKPDIISR